MQQVPKVLVEVALQVLKVPKEEDLDLEDHKVLKVIVLLVQQELKEPKELKVLQMEVKHLEDHKALKVLKEPKDFHLIED